jgi:hypothetical protein
MEMATMGTSSLTVVGIRVVGHALSLPFSTLLSDEL